MLLALCSTDEPVGNLLRGFGLTPVAVETDLARILSGPWEKDRAAFAKLGIDLDRVLETIEANHGPEALTATVTVRPRRRFRKQRSCNDTKPNRDHMPFVPRAKNCLELSLREALRLKQNFIGPEHIALGLLREGQGLACQIITERSIALDTIRASLEDCAITHITTTESRFKPKGARTALRPESCSRSEPLRGTYLRRSGARTCRIKSL